MFSHLSWHQAVLLWSQLYAHQTYSLTKIKPKACKAKGAQSRWISVTDETPGKKHVIKRGGDVMAGHTPSPHNLVLVYNGLWLLFRVSKLASDFSLDQITCWCKWSRRYLSMSICIRSLRSNTCACIHAEGSFLGLNVYRNEFVISYPSFNNQGRI